MMFREYFKDGWNASAIFISSIILIPVISIFSYLFYPSGEIWTHLVNTVLYDYVLNSLILVVFVAFFTAIVGTSTAWLITMFEFPFRRYLELLLVLPLAIPSYALSYIYTELLGAGGIIHQAVFTLFGVNSLYINLYSLPGAIFVFTFSLFPYVYLLSRLSFISQSNSYYNLARLSGASS